MLNNFFSIIPTEQTIRTFGITHLIFLFIGFMIAYIVVKQNKKNIKLIKTLTIIMLLMHGGYYVWHYFSPLSIIEKALPLYTCRLSIYLLAIGIFLNHKSFLKLGVYWSFFGGFFGLIFPSIFDYPFPHYLQIVNFFLHSYIFITSSYYLFVEKIGMTKQDTKRCCIGTVIFLAIVHIFNSIIGSNYSSTLGTPGALLKIGIVFPNGICFILAVVGYLLAIVTQYKLVNYYYKVKDEKDIRENILKD